MRAFAVAVLFAVMIWGPVRAEPALRILKQGETLTDWTWRPLWARDPSAATNAPDAAVPWQGAPSMRIAHTGARDWSYQPMARFGVKAGDLLSLSAWLQVKGEGDAELSFVLYDERGEVRQWTYGRAPARQTDGGRQVDSRILVPAGIAAVEPRLIGNGPATVWMSGFSLSAGGNVEAMRQGLPAALTVENRLLAVTLTTADATLTVTDKRCGHVWRQSPTATDVAVVGARPEGKRGLRLSLLHVASCQPLSVDVHLEADAPEFSLTLAGNVPLARPLAFPHPFASGQDAVLVIPLNEGIAYPAADLSIPDMRLVGYGGHGICMGFWGVVEGAAAHMAIIETPDDAAIRLVRADGLLRVAPEWDSEKGRLGYERKLRYVFFDQGGHVAICKRYRAHAQQVGLFRTLAEKRRANPDVDRLIGAVNVWCWDKDAVGIAAEMQAAGIARILWSQQTPPDVIRMLNKAGVLTSRYDIYQDVMDPANFSRLQWTHPDWTTGGWPRDLMLGPDGQWLRGWEVETKDGQRLPCGVLCDRQALPYAKARIAADLQTHPYGCRFIDTTTASPWRECYSPAHPLTRRESRRYKMDLLALVSGHFNLVTGSETGHEAAVPYVHYFEGMLSLGPYRVPDAGRHTQQIWEEVPANVAKFQVGQRYRLPLWELVYHDCVVAQWYWGDYNNKLPAIWDQRDRFNMLYGTPPMFMFNHTLWATQKDRFVQSYRNATRVARATGYAEMTDHRILTPDRDVQQTRFANGVVVTVNFGVAPWKLADGTDLAAGGWKVAGIKTDQ
jgi:hypothetical protein